MAKKYSERLRSLRGTKTRAEVARAVGISYSALAMYERGERVPKDYIKMKLAKYYKTTVVSIFFAN